MDRVYVMQLVRSFQVGELTRREFLRRATLAVGSAAAANTLLAACEAFPAQTPPPVVEEPAQTAAEAEPTEPPTAEPTTPPTAEPTEPPTAEATEEAQPAETTEANLVTEDITYPDADGETLMGYLARPADEEAHPAVVVIQEWWGLNEHIEDVTRRFAAEGFVALAPDLYKGVVTTEPDEARKMVMELDMAEAVSEIQQAVAFLQEQPYVSGSGVGVVGFCMGGGLALQTGLAEESLGAVVAFYGQPLSPEQAADVNAPVLGLYGAEDGGIPVDAVEAMESGLNEAEIENEIVIYEGAGHAFFNDARESSYNAEAAQDAWPRTLEWFRTHLES